MKGLVSPGDLLSIEFDVQARDKYGRLLAYIYLVDGKMLNEEIVRAGYAQLMTIPPNKISGKVLESLQRGKGESSRFVEIVGMSALSEVMR